MIVQKAIKSTRRRGFIISIRPRAIAKSHSLIAIRFYFFDKSLKDLLKQGCSLSASVPMGTHVS